MVWFSVWKFRETIRLDMVYVCAKLHNFSALRGRDPTGEGCEMGSKDLAFLGLKPLDCEVLHIVTSWILFTIIIIIITYWSTNNTHSLHTRAYVPGGGGGGGYCDATGYCLWCTVSPWAEQFLWFLIKHSLWFHCTFLHFETGNLLFFRHAQELMYRKSTSIRHFEQSNQ